MARRGLAKRGDCGEARRGMAGLRDIEPVDEDVAAVAPCGFDFLGELRIDCRAGAQGAGTVANLTVSRMTSMFSKPSK